MTEQSNDWVSVVVACVLARHPAPTVQPHLQRALAALLHRQRANGGWSYNPKVGTNSGSTAWLLQALLDYGAWKPSALIGGAQFLARHQHRNCGSFSTYMALDRIERFIQ